MSGLVSATAWLCVASQMIILGDFSCLVPLDRVHHIVTWFRGFNENFMDMHYKWLCFLFGFLFLSLD